MTSVYSSTAFKYSPASKYLSAGFIPIYGSTANDIGLIYKELFFPLNDEYQKIIGTYHSPFKIKRLLESIDEIIAHDRARAPHEIPNPMPPGLGKVNYGSLNNSTFGLSKYNQPQQAAVGGGKVNYGNLSDYELAKYGM